MISTSDMVNIKKCKYCGKPYKQKYGFYIPSCDCGCNYYMTDEFKTRVNKRTEMRLRYKSANFPKNLRNKRLRKLTCEYNNEAGVYVHCFHNNTGRGFHYIGKTGNGKTTLAVCIGKELVAKGYTVKFMTFAQFINILQSTYSLKSSLNFKQMLNKFLQYDFLILDDFGKDTYKDKTIADIFNFINALYINKKNIILTSNTDAVEKLKSLAEFSAILDRLRSLAKIRIFENQSFRLLKAVDNANTA